MDELKLNIPGFTIAARTWGNNDLPPLLAIHGWLDNANSFELLAPYLAKHFYIIAIDLPGHGLSSHLYEGGYYHFIDGVFTLINIIDALHIKNINLLGHSLGACLASILAGIAPTRISTVMLIEGLGPFSRPEDTCREQLSTYLFKHIEKKHLKPKLYPSLELAAKARAARGFLSLELVQLLCARGLSESDGKFYWHHDRRLVYPSPLRLTETQVISCLSSIASPTCLILTEQGALFNENDIRQRITAVKNLKLIKMSGGHHLHMERPSVVAQHLVDFYRGN